MACGVRNPLGCPNEARLRKTHQRASCEAIRSPDFPILVRLHPKPIFDSYFTCSSWFAL